ncbi:MAG: hypothetical protein HY914_09700 [Desulfomonile tiedjei]|nr:hypothetical protein [Desulfomonile tiedjei]
MEDSSKTNELLIAEIAELRSIGRGLQEQLDACAAKLDATNSELTEFAYVVSHDLRAPLRAVSQLARWIVEDQGDALNTDGKEMLDLLLSRLDRMHNLLEGILQYSRIGRLKEKEIEVDVDAVVRQVIDSISPRDGIQIAIEKRLPIIKGEQTRVEQVFHHLIDNAVRFMDKPDGLVKIACEDAGVFWQFSVADNGPGIDEAYHEKIFRIFQTLSARDEVETTGVGLTLVKKIVEVNGGRIWLVSAEGQGSTFFLTMPKKGEKHEGDATHSAR